jgi:predicted ATP-grasp superfamily ATP-dependent carboligase
VGKAIVFARRDVVVGDTSAWLDRPADLEIRDIPHPGERIAAGRPVCTVLAGGSDSTVCHAALVRGAERVYEELASWDREVA